jgi:hypothetical protein
MFLISVHCFVESGKSRVLDWGVGVCGNPRASAKRSLEIIVVRSYTLGCSRYILLLFDLKEWLNGQISARSFETSLFKLGNL